MITIKRKAICQTNSGEIYRYLLPMRLQSQIHLHNLCLHLATSHNILQLQFHLQIPIKETNIFFTNHSIFNTIHGSLYFGTLLPNGITKNHVVQYFWEQMCTYKYSLRNIFHKHLKFNSCFGLFFLIFRPPFSTFREQ